MNALPAPKISDECFEKGKSGIDEVVEMMSKSILDRFSYDEIRRGLLIDSEEVKVERSGKKVTAWTTMTIRPKLFEAERK